jgi:hypothetical protein
MLLFLFLKNKFTDGWQMSANLKKHIPGLFFVNSPGAVKYAPSAGGFYVSIYHIPVSTYDVRVIKYAFPMFKYSFSVSIYDIFVSANGVRVSNYATLVFKYDFPVPIYDI